MKKRLVSLVALCIIATGCMSPPIETTGKVGFLAPISTMSVSLSEEWRDGYSVSTTANYRAAKSPIDKMTAQSDLKKTSRLVTAGIVKGFQNNSAAYGLIVPPVTVLSDQKTLEPHQHKSPYNLRLSMINNDISCTVAPIGSFFCMVNPIIYGELYDVLDQKIWSFSKTTLSFSKSDLDENNAYTAYDFVDRLLDQMSDDEVISKKNKPQK